MTSTIARRFMPFVLATALLFFSSPALASSRQLATDQAASRDADEQDSRDRKAREDNEKKAFREEFRREFGREHGDEESFRREFRKESDKEFEKEFDKEKDFDKEKRRKEPCPDDRDGRDGRGGKKKCPPREERESCLIRLAGLCLGREVA